MLIDEVTEEQGRYIPLVKGFPGLGESKTRNGNLAFLHLTYFPFLKKSSLLLLLEFYIFFGIPYSSSTS
jgi:hypothetical protein